MMWMKSLEDILALTLKVGGVVVGCKKDGERGRKMSFYTFCAAKILCDPTFCRLVPGSGCF
jgi:hypothetical protein